MTPEENDSSGRPLNPTRADGPVLRPDGGRSTDRTSAPGFDGWSGQSKPGNTDATYTRTFEWSFRGDRLEWDIEIPISTYEYCTNRARTGQYAIYLADPLQRPFVDSLVERFENHCRDRSLGEHSRLYAALRFVQHLEYTRDVDDTGHETYPKYAIETLVHRRGDCEDGTILLGTLLWAMGYDIAVLLLPDAQHMVLGVAGEEFSGSSVEYEGTSYYVVETTDVGWDVGEFPPRYANTSVRPHHPEAQPILLHEWEATPRNEDSAETLSGNGNLVDVTVHVSNFGDAPADDISVQMEFERRDGDVVGRRALTVDDGPLLPSDFTKYEGTLRVDTERKVRGRCQLGIGRQLHDESESDWQ
ncbi:hypothetical protein [Haloplanus rubicundus]|uniref:Transglutaminase-like domain-containing protein n=1 Tax=Haloplanus rubicundus TaxID=1547898 RepID=A0A345E854_9EURY|nr:hypothetical protein [Haloplanus rubicundus]AXG08376.1 hypothetical protein DU484_00075 [Haloplanus rubicundus]